MRASLPPGALPYAAQHALGRLAPGATPEQARAEMTAFFRRDAAPPGDDHDRTIWKFDEDKYRRAVAESAADGVKSPTHTRFDSGVGLMDDDAVPA